MNNLEASYNKIIEFLDKIERKNSFILQKRKPRMNDKELISMVLLAEYLGIDSEYELFRKLPNSITQNIERSVYNRRKRRLFNSIESLRRLISKSIIQEEEYHIIDSMPLKVCELSRSMRSKICKENFETSPNRGFCASQQMKYYGYKLHAVCTVQGVFRSFDISKASVHDIHYLNDVRLNFENVTIMGDKGYLNKEIQLDLFTYQNIKLEIPMRKNQKDFTPQKYVYKKCRKRIETLFSQLCINL